MSDPFRCAASSLGHREELVGTASTVRAFLLIEAPGPWGVDALQDCRLPSDVKEGLARSTQRTGVRPLLIRRHGRSDPDGLRVFAAYADPVLPWVETTRLEDAWDLRDIDLDALGAGRSPGLEPHGSALFLVCTHGRHDVCCAELGRPVAAALAGAHPEETWEVSHIGGDRFAGNVLVLPHGLYYGRVDAESALGLAEAHLDSRLDLDHLRGRSGYGFAAQAAEIFLRRELDCVGIDALSLRAHRREGAETESVFSHGTQRWTVRVRSTVGQPTQLTCRATRENPATAHTLETCILHSDA